MKFNYLDNDHNTKQKIEISDVDISQIEIKPIELKVLTNKTLQAEPGYFSHSWQSCDWRIIDENGKVKSGLFHERYYTPWMKQPRLAYWLCDCDFKNPEEACIEIIKRGCNPDKFFAQQHFYTQIDGEGCFIITSDFDEALKFYGYKYEPTKEELEEPNREFDKLEKKIEAKVEYLASIGRNKL